MEEGAVEEEGEVHQQEERVAQKVELGVWVQRGVVGVGVGLRVGVLQQVVLVVAGVVECCCVNASFPSSVLACILKKINKKYYKP